MNSLLDPFLYELVRAHEQELLEAARVSRMLRTGPPGLRRVLLAFFVIGAFAGIVLRVLSRSFALRG